MTQRGEVLTSSHEVYCGYNLQSLDLPLDYFHLKLIGRLLVICLHIKKKPCEDHKHYLQVS